MELLLNGAYPLSGFMGRAEVASVREHGRLVDGRPWSIPVVLPVPSDLPRGDAVTLTDPEGAPLARLAVTERWRESGVTYLAGPVTTIERPAHGVFRRLRLSPGDVRERRQRPSDPLLCVVTSTPLHHSALAEIHAAAHHLAEETDTRTPTSATAEVLVLVDTPFHDERTMHAVLAARSHLPAGTQVVAVALPEYTPETAVGVAQGFGASRTLVEPVERPEFGQAELHRMLAHGKPLPGWFTPPEVADELARQWPPRPNRGLTVFFTGLSGSGKSTIARGVSDRIRESGRPVTLLDGDVVRRMLSKGLSFSKEDRDANIRRIGFVAAEIARHGGVAVCAPIAPYAATRAEVRAMVERHGDFVLVHVATPLAECESRDRKGLYAKARAGVIPEFTGVSDPYEVPDDADLTVDTTEISVDHAVDLVLDTLRSGGWVA
ncbi:adenylyl-sulfate kinase [Spiractinospora alimapuensis]|nr:adenylyl-sulfate kinase [Spiractinospora alimapuensis]